MMNSVKGNGTSALYKMIVDKAMNIFVEEACNAAEQHDWAKLDQVLRATEVYARRAGIEYDSRVELIRTIHESGTWQQSGLESCI